jgi:hypothetical protein
MGRSLGSLSARLHTQHRHAPRTAHRTPTRRALLHGGRPICISQRTGTQRGRGRGRGASSRRPTRAGAAHAASRDAARVNPLSVAPPTHAHWDLRHATSMPFTWHSRLNSTLAPVAARVHAHTHKLTLRTESSHTQVHRGSQQQVPWPRFTRLRTHTHT